MGGTPYEYVALHGTYRGMPTTAGFGILERGVHFLSGFLKISGWVEIYRASSSSEQPHTIDGATPIPRHTFMYPARSVGAF